MGTTRFDKHQSYWHKADLPWTACERPALPALVLGLCFRSATPLSARLGGELRANVVP